jgi:hypothetical protein
MPHQMTIEQVTNRVWGIFSSLDPSMTSVDADRRASLKAHISSLIEHGERNADKLTVEGLVYMKSLTAHAKKRVKRRACAAI